MHLTPEMLKIEITKARNQEAYFRQMAQQASGAAQAFEALLVEAEKAAIAGSPIVDPKKQGKAIAKAAKSVAKKAKKAGK